MDSPGETQCGTGKERKEEQEVQEYVTLEVAGKCWFAVVDVWLKAVAKIQCGIEEHLPVIIRLLLLLGLLSKLSLVV